MKRKIILLSLLALLSISVFSFDGKFPTLEGWQAEEPRMFDQENLYEHINGAAGLYLNYAFERLWVEYYRRGGQEFTVEVYQHRSTDFSFGIYTQERPDGFQPVGVGVQGYSEPPILNFLTGKYYVKMYGSNLEDADILNNAGQKICKVLAQQNEFPTLLKVFPEKGKMKNSERFISSDLMGLSFLSNAYSAAYNKENISFTVFVMEKDNEGNCREVLEKYHAYTQQKTKKLKQQKYILNDPFNDKVLVYWHKNYLIGFQGLEDEKIADAMYKGMVEKL